MCVFGPSRNRFAPVGNNSVVCSNFYCLNVFNCRFANTMFLFFRLSCSTFFLSTFFATTSDEKESQPRNFVWAMKGPNNIWRYDWSCKKRKEEMERLLENISRGMLSIFFVRFTCPGPFYTPLPSFQAHPSLFVSLMAFSSLPTFALSPYQSICAYTFNTICLPIALHHAHFLSSRHLITGTLVLIHSRWYGPFSTVLHCEKNIVSGIKEKRKKEKDEK